MEQESAPILVAGSFQKWDAVLGIVAGIGGLVIAAAAWGRITPWEYVASIGGIVVLLASIATLARRTAARRWVTVLPDGLVVSDRHGERHLADDDIIAMNLVHKQNYSNGIYQSTTRRFSIWVEQPDGVRQTEMTTTLTPGAADPLGPLVERIANRLRDEAEQSLSSGYRVEGKGWSLENDALHVARRSSEETIPLSEVVAADIFDRHVCVWRAGIDHPVARVPEGTENAWILLLLLQRRAQSHAEANPSAAGLGRILFERRPSKVWRVLAWVIGAPALLMALVGLAAGLVERKGEVVLTAFFTGLVGVLLITAALALKRRVFRCHEYGVFSVKWFRENRLRYLDVATFTCQKTRMYVNGAYAGTNVVLRFEPLPGVEGTTIKYSASVKNADEALDTLLQHVAQVVAGRMANELSSGKPVAWTPNLTFEAEGLRYRPSGFLGRKEAVFLPYAEMSHHHSENGRFKLFMQGQKKAAIDEGTGEPNFMPGFTLFCMMTAPEPAPPQTAAATPSEPLGSA